MAVIVSLFDHSGNALIPWAMAGHQCYAFDLLHNGESTRTFQGGGSITFIEADLSCPGTLEFIAIREPRFISAFPPCTDMAVSGARHFRAKADKDPGFQIKAARLARAAELLGQWVGCPWYAENPVSVLSSLWRKPDFSFHPWQYGGYLSEHDKHPRWPEYIAARDAYPKKTCIWAGNGFVMPRPIPVDVDPGYSTQFKRLGGKSAKTKSIRSETPRGFAQAVFEANQGCAATA
jgi:hypothetical protein